MCDRDRKKDSVCVRRIGRGGEKKERERERERERKREREREREREIKRAIDSRSLR